MWDLCEKAMHEAIDDVHTGAFPAAEHCFNMKDEQLDRFMTDID